MLKIPEIMTTEFFGGLVLLFVSLFSMVAIIVVDRYRRPEAYKKPNNQPEKKELKTPDQAER